MGKALRDIRFEEWLSYVFDHPADDHGQEWYWDPDADWWGGSAADTIQYLTRAFENAAVEFQPYSDAQLNQGLWFIASNACSDHMLALLDPDVPWPARQQCIRSIKDLYGQCFARRCTPHLSHADEPGAGPLNPVCYMWWDIIPLYGKPDDPGRKELDLAVLGVLESTLQLDSVACQESALHGLGHWQLYYPKQVMEIIDTFLQRQAALPEALRVYAMSARRGHVL